jgi:hypothetical protein
MDKEHLIKIFESRGMNTEAALNLAEKITGSAAPGYAEKDSIYSEYSEEKIAYGGKSEYYSKIKSMMKMGGSPPDWDTEKQANKFIKQARFMEDFNCEYNSSAPFFYSERPLYAHMSLPQLLKYFDWRTKVRRGIYARIEPSYIYLYVYELINGIGTESPQEKMLILIEIWNQYRLSGAQESNPANPSNQSGESNNPDAQYAINARRFDYEMSNFVTDFYLVNVLPDDFSVYKKLFPPYRKNHLSDDSDGYMSSLTQGWSLELVEIYSAHKLTNFAFYKKCDQKLIEQCLVFTLEYLTESIKKEGLDFRSIFVSSCRSLHDLFFCAPYQKKKLAFVKREVTLSKNKQYIYEDGVWYQLYDDCSMYGSTKGYVLRLIESKMRSAMGFRIQLKLGATTQEMRRECMRYHRSWKDAPPECRKMYRFLSGLLFERMVENAVAEFMRSYRVKDGKVEKILPVEINFGDLEKIRRDHEETAAKLNTESEEENKTERIPPQKPAELKQEKQTPAENETFADLLSEAEIEYLKNIDHLSTNELLIESVNEKALDFIGDNLIEVYDGKAQIIEEYKGLIDNGN